MSIERPAIHGIRKRTAPVTLSVASDDWLKLKKPTWAKKSYEVEERNLKHLKPALGSLLLIDISAEDIADYQKSRLKANASPKTIVSGPSVRPLNIAQSWSCDTGPYCSPPCL